MAQKTLLLCCGSKNCPDVTIKDNKIVIHDDFGGSVQMTVEQALAITSTVKKLVKATK